MKDSKYPSDSIKEEYTIWQTAEKIGCPLPKTRVGNRPKCPFCGSKSGFSVKKDRHFHCYRCQKKGSVIDLTMAWLDCDFVEAIKTLSNDIKVQQFDFSKPDLREKAFRYYQEAFEDNPDAQQYAKDRGWDYPMGYAPDNEYLQKRGMSVKDLRSIFLISNRSHLDSEFFQNRLIFPIRDSNGRIAHFQGRSIDPSSNIKWLSTSGDETSINHYLFNGHDLDQVKEKNHLFFAEGIGDALALQKMNIPAVGILGNYMPLQGYKRYLENLEAICFALDNDCYELGTSQEGRYKSWSRMLPEIIDLQKTLDIPIWCYTPPSMSGISDINEYALSIDFDEETFLENVQKRSKPVDKMAWEVFPTDDKEDLFWVFQSLKSPFSTLDSAFQERINKLYCGQWINFFKDCE